MQGVWVWSLGWEDPLEKEMANPLQYSCLENSMDRGAWQATVHGIPRNWIHLSNWAHMHTLILTSVETELIAVICIVESKASIRVTLSLVFLKLNSPISFHLASQVLFSSPLSSRGHWVQWEDGFLFTYCSIGIPSDWTALHAFCSVSFGMISLDTACFEKTALYAWLRHTSCYPWGFLTPFSALSTRTTVIFHCLFIGLSCLPE